MKKLHPTLLRWLLPCMALAMAGCTSFAAEDPGDTDALRAFTESMAERHGMDAEQLTRLLVDDARHQSDIIDAITRPAEALPWYRYRAIFLTEARVNEGVAFMNTHAEILEAVQQEYGVPPAIVTAIIGVETFYGRYRGQHRVIDALRTLGFGYPPREAFFRRELEAFLLLAQEEGFDPREPRGSYAGAMGVPQFISSSYRAYAVDFDGDGRRDLFNSMADAIGSVGHYFAQHRWRAGEPVAIPARPDRPVDEALLSADLRPRHTVAELQAAGVNFDQPLDPGAGARLLVLDADGGDEHWVTLHNFYVITRYNHSPLYAMAVYQLAQALEASDP
nr:lytic murein transglycosylase B [Spiribacter sp. 2438]